MTGLIILGVVVWVSVGVWAANLSWYLKFGKVTRGDLVIWAFIGAILGLLALGYLLPKKWGDFWNKPVWEKTP